MCGVFGIFNHPEAANLTYLGLHALQHRGQESAGIVTSDGGTLHAVRKMGLVSEIFTPDLIAQLPGTLAIGHVRYTTAGGSLPKNIQPLTAEYRHQLDRPRAQRQPRQRRAAARRPRGGGRHLRLAVGHRGHPPADGAQPADGFTERLIDALGKVRGAYSLVLTTADRLIAVRDPHGFRPLVLGRLRSQPSSYVVASETCAFDLIEAEKIRDIGPGEILIIDRNGLQSVQMRREPRRFCVFEHVYFARPDSVLDDLSVYDARIAMGEQLARESPSPPMS
jgi:amidophosphoribosyltransferase